MLCYIIILNYYYVYKKVFCPVCYVTPLSFVTLKIFSSISFLDDV